MPGKTSSKWRDILLQESKDASMRPQRNAGENGDCRLIPQVLRTESRCFNEAPAKCLGKPGFPGPPWRASWGFNEAPAKCRGKPPITGSQLAQLTVLQ